MDVDNGNYEPAGSLFGAPQTNKTAESEIDDLIGQVRQRWAIYVLLRVGTRLTRAFVKLRDSAQRQRQRQREGTASSL